MKLLLLKSLAWLAVLLIVVPILLLIAGQLGWLKGRPPANLGVRDGRLKPPSRTPNSVSSQAQLHDASRYLVDYARIEPLRYAGDGAAALARIKRILDESAGAKVIESKPDYLYAQFTSRWLKFVDDVEFWLSPSGGVIHLRSASRIGRKDFGANRARIEAIRARFDASK
jgi:uncharacterized protein (DUF1499 family)